MAPLADFLPRFDIPDLRRREALLALGRHLAQNPLRPRGTVNVRADGVDLEDVAPDERVGLVGGVEVLDLDLDLVPLRVAVVHAAGHAVVDGPVRLEPYALHVGVRARHGRQVRKRPRHVLQPREVALLGLGVRRLQDADAVVLVVVAQEREVFLFEDDFRVEELLVEKDHLVVVLLRGAKHDVRQRDWAGAGAQLAVAVVVDCHGCLW